VDEALPPANPSHTPLFACNPCPFRYQVDQPLTVQDIMNMNRDQYEGTPFDLTKGSAS
jgi:dipeptidase